MNPIQTFQEAVDEQMVWIAVAGRPGRSTPNDIQYVFSHAPVSIVMSSRIAKSMAGHWEFSEWISAVYDATHFKNAQEIADDIKRRAFPYFSPASVVGMSFSSKSEELRVK